MPRACACVTVLLLVAAQVSRAQGVRELGVDVFGLSWHYDGATYFDGTTTRRYQGQNLGAGLHVTLGARGRHVWMIKAGGYEDSMHERAWYGGPVWQYRIGAGLQAGAGVLLMDSKSLVLPVVPLPLITYRVKRVALSMTWFPPGEPGASGALAFFGTLVLWKRP